MAVPMLRAIFRGNRLRVEVYTDGTRDGVAELSPEEILEALATPESGRSYLEIDLEAAAVVLSLTAPGEDES